ncbi:hypothetical protein D1BOALGB6SA_6057 [Olavius sp. associated proteobacterium Delta 1]|nr:hypothetical protein D1BOALGB6SA_6057 [Olavius sp. associated proteobacterium Delta 1]
MDILPQITVSIKPELYQSVLKTSSFKPGSTLRLKVIELRGDRALIDFGHFRATADVKIPVALGEELLVKVQESGPQLRLCLLNPELKTISSTDSGPPHLENLSDDGFKGIQKDIKQILNQILAGQSVKNIPKPILNILEGLNTHFETFNLEKVIAEVMPRLKLYVDHSGIFFEKMLESVIARLLNESEAASSRQLANHPDVQTIVERDLKASLLVLKNFVENDASLQKTFDSRTMTTMRQAVDVLLTDITNQQGRAVRQLDSTEPFQVFTYALPLEEEKQAAKLKIYYQKKQKAGSKKGFQISLLLSMDRLGEVRTDFYLLDTDLKVTFFVKDPSTKAKIQENCLDLQEILNPFFNQTLVQVIVSEKKIKDFDRENVQITSDRKVDLLI